MPKHLPPTKPTFVQNFTWTQKILAGLSCSLGMFAAITLIPFVQRLYEPDGLLFLSYLRMGFATASLLCGAFVGITQLRAMAGWFFEFYEYYKKFTEFKNNGGEDPE